MLNTLSHGTPPRVYLSDPSAQKGAVGYKGHHKIEFKADLRELIRIANLSKDTLKTARDEAAELWEFYDGKHFTDAQCKLLFSRGSPAEYKNIIMEIANAIQGYFLKVQNTAILKPRGQADSHRVMAHQSHIEYVKSISDFDDIQGQIILESLLSGLCATEYVVAPTGKKDEFGTPINEIKVVYVPSKQVMIDPYSVLPDYSDALFIHRWRWVGQRWIRGMFGSDKLQQLEARHIAVEGFDSEFDDVIGLKNDSWYDNDRFFIMETQYRREDNTIERIFWHDNIILSREVLPTNTFTYRVVKYKVDSKTEEYYGEFRNIKENQKALNQAIISFQGLMNGFRVIAQEGTFATDKEKMRFQNAMFTANQVAFVQNLNGVMIHNLQPQAQLQAQKILDTEASMFKVLGLNPAFLGFSDASSSGRKVSLQQNAAINSLTRLFNHLEKWHKYIMLDIIHFTTIYKNAYEVVTLTDEYNAQYQIEFNAPLIEKVELGSEVWYIPKTYTDKNGNIRRKNDPRTDLSEIEVDIEVHTSDMNGSDSIDAVMLDNLINGVAGQSLMNAQPAAYFYIIGLKIKNLKTKNSEQVAQIYFNIAQQLGFVAPTVDPRQVMQNQTGVAGNIQGQAGDLVSSLGADSDLSQGGLNG